MGWPILALAAYILWRWRRAIRDEEQSGTHYMGMRIHTDGRAPGGTAVTITPERRQNER